MQFFTVPRTLAWIGSSLAIVVLATILFALRGKARVAFAISLAVAIALTALLSDQALGVLISFAQPGLIVLLAFALAALLVRSIDRRGAVFLPRGMIPQSTVPRIGRREPSTVDAPAIKS